MLLQPYHFLDIAAKFLDPEEDNGIDEDIDDIDVEVEGPNRPSDIELEEALDKLFNLSFFSSGYGREIQSPCLEIDDLLHKEKLDELRKCHVTDLFRSCYCYEIVKFFLIIILLIARGISLVM